MPEGGKAEVLLRAGLDEELDARDAQDTDKVEQGLVKTSQGDDAQIIDVLRAAGRYAQSVDRTRPRPESYKHRLVGMSKGQVRRWVRRRAFSQGQQATDGAVTTNCTSVSVLPEISRMLYPSTLPPVGERRARAKRPRLASQKVTTTEPVWRQAEAASRLCIEMPRRSSSVTS